MTEGVARRWLGDPGGTDRIFHRPLEQGFVELVAAPLAGHGLYVETRGGKDPFAAGIRVLAQERAGHFDLAGAWAEVGLVLLASAFQVGGQGGLTTTGSIITRTARAPARAPTDKTG